MWLPGIISEVTGPVSYVIELTDGRTVRRHQDHVRRRHDVLPEPLLIPEQVVEPVAETRGDKTDVQQEQDTGCSPSVPKSQECVMPERRYPVRQRHPPERFM